jgi:hypothetical protein
MSEFKFGNLNYKILILLLSLRVCGPGSPGCVLKDLLGWGLYLFFYPVITCVDKSTHLNTHLSTGVEVPKPEVPKFAGPFYA